MSSLSYLLINVFLLIYVVYSWYWQANIDFSARFRFSSVIWTAVFIGFGFYADYFEPAGPYLATFIAIALLMSVIDGCSGLTAKRIVVSGYFKRTIKYQDLAHITLLTLPNAKRPTVMAVFQTQSRHAYYLRFSKQVEEIIQTLKGRISGEVSIDVRTMIQ